MAPKRFFQRKGGKKHYLKKSMKASPLNKIVKKAVVAYERRHNETKYVADAILDNQPVKNEIISGGTSSTMLPVIPPTTQGTESFQRVGTRISPVALKCNVTLDFDPTFQLNFDGWVKLFFVSSKKVKSDDLLKSIPAGNLLDNGQGSAVDWNSAIPTVVASYPVKNEDWSVVKTITVKMSKNVGQTTGSATNPYSTNTGHSSKMFSFKLPLAKNLIYDDSTVLQAPTNHSILLGMTYWASDSTVFDGNVIRATVHSHLYYKDT